MFVAIIVGIIYSIIAACVGPEKTFLRLSYSLVIQSTLHFFPVPEVAFLSALSMYIRIYARGLMPLITLYDLCFLGVYAFDNVDRVLVFWSYIGSLLYTYIILQVSAIEVVHASIPTL